MAGTRQLTVVAVNTLPFIVLMIAPWNRVLHQRRPQQRRPTYLPSNHVVNVDFSRELSFELTRLGLRVCHSFFHVTLQS